MQRDITRTDLQEAIEGGAITVVDALPSRPYSKRHLPHAVNVVAEDTDETVRAILTDPGAAIAVYSTDTDCERAPELATRLRDLGYTDVRLYSGGIDDWIAAGLPVDVTASTPGAHPATAPSPTG